MVLILSDAPPAARTPWLPFQGPIPPIRGKCPEGTKGVGTLSPKVTERSSQICCNLSVSAFRRATSPERGGFFAHTAKIFVKTNKNPIQTLQPHTVHGTMTLYFPEMAKKRVPAFLLQVCRRRLFEKIRVRRELR